MSTETVEQVDDELTYREQDVDETLDDHDRRISRLEKLALLAVGYVTADAPDVVRELSTLLI
jgi:hypothetical protein